MLKYLYGFFITIATILSSVNGQTISSFSWINNDIPYYIVSNRYIPRFYPEVSVTDLVQRAQKEYELPGITLNLTYMGMIYTNRRQTKDNINTISFYPDTYPAETLFYSSNLLQRMEFDMRFNTRVYKTPESLYLSILHEFGHVFGLDHPVKGVDSVMGKSLTMNPDGSYVQESKYLKLTQSDIISLYRHEAIFRSNTVSGKMFLNSVLLSILSSYPSSIQEQMFSCENSGTFGRFSNQVTYREGRGGDDSNQMGLI